MIGLLSLAGLLTGILCGALAASLRRHVIPIIALPVVLAPLAYLGWWHDALSWTCLHARAFGTADCVATRSFVETTLTGLPGGAVMAATHLLAGVTLALVLMGVRRTIARAIPPLERTGTPPRPAA